MSIIPYLAAKDVARDSDTTFETRLACGQSWEHSLTEYLKSQVLDKVYQVDQYIPYRAAYYSFKPDPENWRARPTSKLYPHLYPRFQRDIRVIHSGKGYNIEVKSKSGIFGNLNILVGGKSSRWDKYRFPVHYVIAIDRATGEARVTEADKLTRETSWLSVKSQELSYAVPRHLFKPLDSWLDFLKSQ